MPLEGGQVTRQVEGVPELRSGVAYRCRGPPAPLRCDFSFCFRLRGLDLSLQGTAAPAPPHSLWWSAAVASEARVERVEPEGGHFGR